MARDIPVCAMIASRFASALVRVASVATTASVVLACGVPLVTGDSAASGNGEGKPQPPNSAPCSNGPAQNHGPPPTTTLPTALTATRAPTVRSEQVAEAEPRPPLRLTVVAPSPAPTLPSAKSLAAPAAAA